MKTKVLGKDTSNLKLKGIKLLEKIKRNKSDIKYGTDIWNVYDFLYLYNDLPSLKVLEIKIPSNSLFTIESKSMKLYLNGFYNQSFKSDKTVIQQIKKDLEGFLNAKIKLRIIKKFNQEPPAINLNNYKNDKTKINTILKFNGFRSICPVTSQPDFATIYIQHKSEVTPSMEIIDHLLTYRTKGEFHERCIEDICSHLSLSFNLKSLTVIGRFMRRGGIDINPIRSLAKNYPKKNIHDTFQ